MSLRYTFRESISGFKRAKLSFFVSITTIIISLLLLGVFTVVTVNTSRFIDMLRTKVEMEAFVQEPISTEQIARLQKQIASIEGIEKVVYISKEEAARIFQQEFGEDIKKVLEFNPLPPSFKIYLKEGYRTSASAQTVSDRLASTKGIESIIYRKTLLELIDQRTATIHNITLGLGLLVGLSAIFLVSNTIRLAIHAKQRLLRTMELVGATATFIRLPFLLEGLLQGFLGGLVAAGLLYVLLVYVTRLLSLEFSEFIHMDPAFYLLVLGTGVFLGLLGSMISVVRFIKPARPA
jgi:cell division transport system permease protein